MKRLSTLFLSLLALTALSGCNQNKGDKYVRPIINNGVYDVEIPTIDSPVVDIKILNIPKTAIEVGYMSYMGIEVEIHYASGEVVTIPFTERLFPIDQLEMLKTPGQKTIDFLFKGNHIYFDLTLMEAKVPVYHKVVFQDHNNTTLKEKVFGYLEPAIYDGRDIESYWEGDYYYYFNNKWDHNTDYVYCDFITHAEYDTLDIRNKASKYVVGTNIKHADGQTYRHTTLATIKNIQDSSGDSKVLYYLGEVNNVEIAHSETIYHEASGYSRIEGNFENVTNNEIIHNITDMAKEVYRVNNTSDTARYPFDFITNGSRLNLDFSADESGKPKDLGNRLDEAYGKPNYPRTDGRAVSHDPVLYGDIIDDIKQSMVNTSLPLYEGTRTGYYRISYVAKIDLLLDTYYMFGPMSSSNYMSRATLIPCYYYGSLKPILSYSEDGSFTDHYSTKIEFGTEDLIAMFAD